MCSKHGKYHGSEKEINTLLLLCAAVEQREVSNLMKAKRK